MKILESIETELEAVALVINEWFDAYPLITVVLLIMAMIGGAALLSHYDV